MSKTSTLHKYARVGAAARIRELQAEIAEIHRIFPDLDASPAHRRPRRPMATAAAQAERPAAEPKRRRSKISAAGRKAISDAQKKRWAALKAKK